MAAPQVDARTLGAMLADGAELALLDVRDEGVFASGHLFHAVPAPLARLELVIDRLVPRRSTRVVLCDGGGADDLADRAAARLGGFGYTDVTVLADGIAGWRAAGGELFAGTNVPSKAFGEHVEHVEGTPSISAEELKALVDAGTDMVILDSRPLNEFRRVSIPGAIDCPGAELVHRVFELAPRPEQLVVVNCAGRTRSIIGAQSLINAGVPNKVVSLKNGTQDWHLYGYQVLKGSKARAPAVSAAGAEKARAAAVRVAERFGIPCIDTATLARWQAEPDRTTYVFDVRTADEYAAGHVPGMKHIAGGQLVQETDRHAAVWGARVVLVDDDGVRAIMTAHWMKQMGWDASASTLDMRTAGTETGAWKPRVLGIDAAAPGIEVSVLAGRLRGTGVSVVDVDWSSDYRKGHVPGAWFGLRSQLADVLGRLPAADTIVFTSGDGRLAQLATADARALRSTPAFALAGGTQAWHAAGLPLESGETRMASAPDDIRLKAREQKEGIEDAMKAYLKWEIELAEQMAADDDQRFRILTP